MVRFISHFWILKIKWDSFWKWNSMTYASAIHMRVINATSLLVFLCFPLKCLCYFKNFTLKNQHPVQFWNKDMFFNSKRNDLWNNKTLNCFSVPHMPRLDTIENCMKLSPMVVQALWDNKSPLLQLPHIKEDMLRHFVTKRVSLITFTTFSFHHF